MMKNVGFKILIAGGDCRQRFLAKRLALSGAAEVFAIGLGEGIDGCRSVSEDKLQSGRFDGLVLPVSMTDETVYTPYHNKKLMLGTVLLAVKKGGAVFSGMLSKKAEALILSQGYKLTRYLEIGELVLKNAYLTAEGALSIAIAETPQMLFGSTVSVLGLGRVGKACAELFSKAGANVLVCDRKAEKRRIAKSLGFLACGFEDERAYQSDIIINTVPTLVLSFERLIKTKPEALIIDLASKPGGVDLEAAGRLKRNVIWALSLPARFSPKTAGEIIADEIEKKISGEEQ